ncbi:SDR family NAD(P)-dependent oxidoreductase [Domibacillus epiphyticus]|uniref:2-deoxy-D-gluconate 3-dehydrogenase n=1 Tax=Domibacillus epiphyticus TaxID=1714355 RepID=A0A1V2A6C8_9BACI|nr:glucose 1-dehydrogenase [Domibacillus epiphyticus]OMP66374.1 2-deoxy-D-gluconate 3-dehydrogenase [Domibacillus epiphyticus]
METYSFPSFRLDNKTAVVTGGSKGLGLAIAAGFANAGANVMITGRNESALKVAVDQLATQGLTVQWKTADVTNREEVASLFEYVDEQFPRLDILVNNAGMNIRKPLIDIEEDDWDQVLGTNLKGIFLVGQQAAMRMMNQKSGRIINISSILGQIGMPAQTSYAASKGGINQLTKVWAAELAPYNVTVNAVAPAYIKTPMTEPWLKNPERLERIVSRTMMKRIGEPSEVMGPAVFLASDASGYVTGQILHVDGGWTSN